MEFSVLLADLRDVAEKYKGKTTEPQVSTNAYVDMFTKILKRAEKSTENYDDKITVLWVALNQLASIYKDLSAGPAKDQLCKFIFGLCAKTVLNIQWSQLDDDSKVKTNFSTTVENVHEILSAVGFQRFQLILDLMESHWTHPILSKIMSGDDEDTEDCLEYIQKEDPEILKLRIEIMMNENCEEFALNLCNWSLKHPSLQNDLKIKEQQIYILYKQQEYEKMQEVCETIICHDGIKVMSHLAKNQANQNLCIRLAQVFLIQDWINPERTCCTQELLQLWIHHQYLADKDEERFLDSIWTVAKVCRDTEQIGVLIDGVKKECGDMFVQLYTELCKYAINIDKGNMEREEVQNDKEEMKRRKLAMSKTCVRMAFMLKEYDFRMSRICGLTAFALEPTMDNLNLVNKLYWTHKNVSAASKNSKIDIATLYEIERLLGLMRPESLKPEYSWKQLIPLCKKFKSDSEHEKFGKSSVSASVQNFAAGSMPEFITSFDKSNMGNVQNKARKKPPQMTTKDIERAHLAKLLGQKNIPPDQIERILSKHFPRNSNKQLQEGPSLNMKQLDKTIDDLKKSIYLETEYRESMKHSLSSLHRSKKGDSSVHSNSSQNQHVSRMEQFRQLQQSSQNKQSNVQRQHSVPGGSNTQGNNLMHRHGSVDSRQPPTAHSHHRPQQFSPVGFGGSPPPAHSSVGRMSSPVSVDGPSKIRSPGELGNNHKNPYLHHSSHSKTVSEQLSNRIKDEFSRQPHQKTASGNLPFHILRPPGNDKQECAKIAQQIAELHEKQRAERERLEKIRLMGQLDGVKAVLNSRNIASRSQISDLLTLTFQGNKSTEKQNSLDTSQSKSYSRKKSVNSSNVMSPTASSTQGPAACRTIQPKTEAPVSKPPTKKAHANILRQGEKTWDAQRGMMKQKYYLSTECMKSTNNKQDVKTTQSDSSVKPVYSMIVPKSLTTPERTEDLVNAVTNIIKNFPQGGETVPRVALHSSHQSVKTQNVANVSMATTENASIQGTAVNQMSATSVPLMSNCNSSTVGMISPNSLCIPVTGHTATIVSNNNLLNLNTLANASVSVSVLGQAGTPQPQLGQQFQVSLQQPQQLLNPVIDSPQLFTTIQTGQQIQQVCQQPDPIYGTPLYSVSQPLVTEPSIAITGIPTTVGMNQTINPQANTVQNQPITLDTGQFLGAVNQQQTSFQVNVSNNMTNRLVNPPQVVQATKQKQCLSTPELSPALVQQILSSIKSKAANIKGTEKIPAASADKKTNQTTARSAKSNNDKQPLEQVKGENEVLQKGVLEAHQKILQLRKQFGNEADGKSTGKKQLAGGIIESLVADVSDKETIKTGSGLPTFMSPVSSVIHPNVANTVQEIVPDLPDLGAKEFHIDDLLALDNDVDKSADNSNSITKPNLESSNSGPLMNNDRAQSTYLNANRLAKERENREAKTQNKPSKLYAKEAQGKGIGKCVYCGSSFSTLKLLEDHKANSSCGKPFQCDFCKMVFKSLELLNTHEKNYCLKAPTIVKCHICGVYFESHEQLKAHLVPRTCSPRVGGQSAFQQNDIVCGICERTVESMAAMKEHVQKGCQKKTTTKKEIKMKDYEYEILFQCTRCNFMNSAERSVLKHVEKCKEKNSSASMRKLYKCRMCNEIFSVTEDICRHVSKQCPKLRVTNNQRQVQDSYQKLKNANMLQNNKSKSQKTVASNYNAKDRNSRIPCVDDQMSIKVPYNSETSAGLKHSKEKVFNVAFEQSAADLSVSKEQLHSKSGLILRNMEDTSPENNALEQEGSDLKLAVSDDDVIDEKNIKLQKEMRISAEKQFLEEFNRIEKRKQEIRMKKQREIAKIEQAKQDKIERENLEAEKKKFIENILGKVSLQEKIKIDASAQKKKVFRVELRKSTDEVKLENNREPVEESHKSGNEDTHGDQKRQEKSNKDTKCVSRKSIDVKEETKEYKKHTEGGSSKKRRKSDEVVEEVVDKTRKRLRVNSENRTVSPTTNKKTETKKKRLSPQDIRKLKGLRAKRLIKQKKYYMDEMDPLGPIKRNVDIIEKKAMPGKVTRRSLELGVNKGPHVKVNNDKKNRNPIKDKLSKNEQKYIRLCRFCKIENKPHFRKRLHIIIHYVRGHKLGYRNEHYQLKCNFCKQTYPSSQTAKMNYHVYDSHPWTILEKVASGKYDYLVGHKGVRVSPRKKMSNKLAIGGRGPRKNEKKIKHLRALALRQKCAEKLKRIAMHARNSSDDSSEVEEVNIESTSSTDGDISNKEVTKTTVSKSGRKIAPRLDRQLVPQSDLSKTRRQSRATENNSEETEAKRLLRSRSSSLSSNRSSIIVSAKKRKAALNTMRQKRSPSGEKLLITRSGRAVRRPDLGLSQSTESSGMDDEDTSELEDANIRKRKSARIRRLSEKGKSKVEEPTESEDSVSEEAVVRVTRRSLRGPLNESLDDKLPSRTRRSSGRNVDRTTESVDDQGLARKENRSNSVRSPRERRKSVREERIVTRQSSKNEEESDSETEGSFTDTEASVQTVNAQGRRGGERSAESDSESTSYDDRRKRYRFRRRKSKRVYQVLESSENEDTEKVTTANDDSDFECSDELEEFRSSDTRNSFDDDSNMSSRLGLQQKSMAKVVEKQSKALVRSFSDESSELCDEPSSPMMDKGLLKSKPVILAQDNDDEFAGLETEPVGDILHPEKGKCELTEKSEEEKSAELDVGKTMDEMLELVPMLSENIPTKSGKPKLLKEDSENKPSIEKSQTSKLSSPFMSAYTQFIQSRETPSLVKPNLKLPSEITSKEQMKSAVVVMKDIALEGVTSKCKIQQTDKLIQACRQEKCVVKINRLSEHDLEKHYHYGTKNKNSLNDIDIIIIDDDDGDILGKDIHISESKIGKHSDQPSQPSLIPTVKQNLSKENMKNDSSKENMKHDLSKVNVKNDLSKENVTEVLIQDADLSYSIDQLIAEENMSDFISHDTGLMKANMDTSDSNTHAENVPNDVKLDSNKEKSTISVDENLSSCPVEDKCLAEVQGGEDVVNEVDKTKSEVPVINVSNNEEPNEVIWIENEETYADESKNDQADESENVDSKVQIAVNKEEVTHETDENEIEIKTKAGESGEVVNAQEIIIDNTLPDNIVCTIGNSEDAGETVLQIEVDGDTDILQLVVESSSDGTSANIVVAEHDVCIGTTTLENELDLDAGKSVDKVHNDDIVPEKELDCTKEKSINRVDKDDNVAEITHHDNDNVESLEADRGKSDLKTDTEENVSDDHEEVKSMSVESAGIASPSKDISELPKLDSVNLTTDKAEILQETVNSPVTNTTDNESVDISIGNNEVEVLQEAVNSPVANANDNVKSVDSTVESNENRLDHPDVCIRNIPEEVESGEVTESKLTKSDKGNAVLETDMVENITEDYETGLRVENMNVESTCRDEVEMLPTGSAGIASQSKDISELSMLDSVNLTINKAEILRETMNSPVTITTDNKSIDRSIGSDEGEILQETVNSPVTNTNDDESIDQSIGNNEVEVLQEAVNSPVTNTNDDESIDRSIENNEVEVLQETVSSPVTNTNDNESIDQFIGNNDDQNDVPGVYSTDISEQVESDEVAESKLTESSGDHVKIGNTVSETNIQSENQEGNVINNSDTIENCTPEANHGSKSNDHALEDGLKQDMLPVDNTPDLQVIPVCNNASLLNIQAYSDSDSDIELIELNVDPMLNEQLKSGITNKVGANESSVPVISNESHENDEEEECERNVGMKEDNDNVGTIHSYTDDDSSGNNTSKPDDAPNEDSHTEMSIDAVTVSHSESSATIQIEFRDSVKSENKSEIVLPKTLDIEEDSIENEHRSDIENPEEVSMLGIEEESIENENKHETEQPIEPMLEIKKDSIENENRTDIEQPEESTLENEESIENENNRDVEQPEESILEIEEDLIETDNRIEVGQSEEPLLKIENDLIETKNKRATDQSVEPTLEIREELIGIESISEIDQRKEPILDAGAGGTLTNLNEGDIHEVQSNNAIQENAIVTEENIVSEMPADNVQSNDLVSSSSGSECNNKVELLTEISTLKNESCDTDMMYEKTEESNDSCSNCTDIHEQYTGESDKGQNLNESHLENTDLKEVSDVKNMGNFHTNNETFVDKQNVIDNDQTKLSSVSDCKDSEFENVFENEDIKLIDISVDNSSQAEDNRIVNVDVEMNAITGSNSVSDNENSKVEIALENEDQKSIDQSVENISQAGETCMETVSVSPESNSLVSVTGCKDIEDLETCETEVEIKICGDSSATTEELNDSASVPVVESFRNETIESALNEAMPCESTDKELAITGNLNQDSILEIAYPLSNKETPELVDSTSENNDFERDASDDVAIVQNAEVKQPVPIIQNDLVPVCEAISEESLKSAVHVINNVIEDILSTNSCHENTDVCVESKEISPEPNEETEDDMIICSLVSSNDESKDEECVVSKAEVTESVLNKQRLVSEGLSEVSGNLATNVVHNVGELLPNKQESVREDISENSEKWAEKTINNVFWELLLDSCLAVADSCIETENTHLDKLETKNQTQADTKSKTLNTQLDTQLETKDQTEGDMTSPTVTDCDSLKSEEVKNEKVQYDDEKSDNKNVIEHAELSEVDTTNSVDTDAVVSISETTTKPDIDENVTPGHLKEISGEVIDDVSGKIPQESNIQTPDEIGNKDSGEISSEVNNDLTENISGRTPDNTEIVLEIYSQNIPESSTKVQRVLCPESPKELVTGTTVLDNLSEIPETFNHDKPMDGSSTEFSSVTDGFNNDKSVQSERSALDKTKEEYKSVESAPLPNVQYEGSSNKIVLETKETSVKQITEMSYNESVSVESSENSPKSSVVKFENGTNVSAGNTDDVTSHEKLLEGKGQGLLETQSLNSVKTGEESDVRSEDKYILEDNGVSKCVSKLDEGSLDIKEVVRHQNEADNKVTDLGSEVEDVTFGSAQVSVFPVFRRKGMICSEKRPRKSPKKDSANNGNQQKEETTNKKVCRNIGSKRSGSPVGGTKYTSAVESSSNSKDIIKKSVSPRSQLVRSKQCDNYINAIIKTIPPGTDQSRKTKCVNKGDVKVEAKVKSRRLLPVKSNKDESGKKAVDNKSQVQLIEKQNKNSAKKVTNNTNAKKLLTAEPCNKTFSDKSKTSTKKEKSLDKQKQAADVATVGDMFKRVKSPVVSTNTTTTDTITCSQREDETEEEFRRRTENVRQARRKSASKSYESDFNFENSDEKSSSNISSPRVQSHSFWPSDSETNIDGTSFYSSSSGTSSAKDGNSKLHKRLARDFGHEDSVSLSKNSTPEKTPIVTRGTIVATSNQQTVPGKTNTGRRTLCVQVVQKAKMQNVSDALKLGSKTSMHSVVQNLASDLKDEVSMGKVHNSLENAVLGKVKAFRALRKESRPFNWEESPSAPKRRKQHYIGEITDEVKNIMGKDRKGSACMKVSPRGNKVTTTVTVTNQSTTRSLRDKKGKESTNDKAAVEKKDGVNVKKQDDEIRRMKKGCESKSPDRVIVRTRSMSGSVERTRPSTGKTVDKTDKEGEKQAKAEISKKAKLSPQSIHDTNRESEKHMKAEISKKAKLSPQSTLEESVKRTKPVKLTRSLRSMERDVSSQLSKDSVNDKDKRQFKIDVSASKVQMAPSSFNGEKMTKDCKCKLDGTSTSPEIGNRSCKCKLDGTSTSPETGNLFGRKCDMGSSVDECSRQTRRQVIHGGKVFEIQRGRVLETDLQDLSMHTTIEENKPTMTVHESVSIKRSRRISDQRKRALSPEGIVDSNMCLNSGSTDINKYIRDTLEDIKKLRRSNKQSPWTFQKSGAKRSQKKTYPYEFKKS